MATLCTPRKIWKVTYRVDVLFIIGLAEFRIITETNSWAGMTEGILDHQISKAPFHHDTSVHCLHRHNSAGDRGVHSLSHSEHIHIWRTNSTNDT